MGAIRESSYEKKCAQLRAMLKTALAIIRGDMDGLGEREQFLEQAEKLFSAPSRGDGEHWAIELTVCVTKPITLEEAKPILEEFIAQRETFGLIRINKGRYEIWREAHDSWDKRLRGIERPIPEPKFRFIWDRGILVQKEYRRLDTHYREDRRQSDYAPKYVLRISA